MKKFQDLGIDEKFVKGLNELNIIQPTDIQKKVIPILLNENTDIVAQAQTGTGKTAAFGLPLLSRIDSEQNHVQGLVLCPTRELAKQVSKQLFKFTKYSEKIFVETVYGGERIERQISSLQRTTHIIVATPGRLIDLIDKKAVDLRKVDTVILDEADEMLSMGFQKQLDQILSFLPKVKNKWLFSATIPGGIQEIISKHLSKNAERIEVQKADVVNKNITHQYLVVDESEKLEALLLFLKVQHKNRGVVFCKTKKATQKLAKQLIAKNVEADAIHGDLLQKERDKVMRAFKNENLRILVATDVSARGIDVPGLTFVVHYQLPESLEYYTHRSGRTARAGNEGVSISFVNNAEAKNLKDYERKLGIRFEKIKRGK
ncbi:DEAD/DEAH box helicase [Brumimicrobium aurantiacum]|uniref:DEAD/DEAH box helicase n=1 Tax=Brumimicrobium aurantiacum TaxID=1737063 RepID=A0A3E1EV38_9FLAO|nr:DEAD/DEAH box helicase [Brumimicrobium aurantiacum]RFC53400.1 DEAD/DEAH box helicase [Brumimicrobium aurantiacum]